ncbi:MAG TPA: hypothetical protein VF016_05410, partial [Nitrososphaera sp.]
MLAFKDNSKYLQALENSTKCFYSNLLALTSMNADSKAKTLLRSKVTLLGLVAVVAVLVAPTVAGTALAYKENDPAVPFHCWQTNEDKTLKKTADGDLIPCEINTGDNAWMLTSSALVLMMTPAGLA